MVNMVSTLVQKLIKGFYEFGDMNIFKICRYYLDYDVNNKLEGDNWQCWKTRYQKFAVVQAKEDETKSKLLGSNGMMN